MGGSPARAWLDAHAGQATIALRQSQMGEVTAAAAEGAGIAPLPCFLGDAGPRLRRLLPDVLVRQRLALVFRRETGDDMLLGRRVLDAIVRARARAGKLLAGEAR